MKSIKIETSLANNEYSSTEIRNRVYELEKIKREEKVEEVIEQYSPKLLKKYMNDESKGN